MKSKEVHIWNLKFNLQSLEEIVNIVDSLLKEGKTGVCLVGVDSHVAMIAQTDDILRKSIVDSDLVNVDSYITAKFLKRAGYGDGRRVPTPDIMDALLAQAERTGRKVFFLGATDSTLAKLHDVLTRECPNLVIAGMRNGYFNKEEEIRLVNQISSAAPDYLFIGMPSPYKENFIAKYKHSLSVGCFYGVGGALDAKAGVMKRPPKAFREHGLEGLFRVLRNPKVYWTRILSVWQFSRMARRWEKSRIR